MADSIPTLPGVDSSLRFLRDGYLFGAKACRQLGTDAFHTRLTGRPVTVMLGADASRLFWSGGRFDRHGSTVPSTATHLLQDDGSTQTLEGAAHSNRKGMFLQMMEPGDLDRIQRLFAEEWQAALPRWSHRGAIDLHEELKELLTRTVLRWVGLIPENVDYQARTEEFGMMIENAGRFGPRNWAARMLRHRTERWAREVIEATRRGEIDVPEDLPLARIARQTNVDGSLLDIRVAGVELLNATRPVVAIGRFIVFAALCLHLCPQWDRRFRDGDQEENGHFVAEVRRHSPFFPVMGGRATGAFEWRGHEFHTGDWVILDLYGTNHDPALWAEPNSFRPERFRDWAGDPYTMIPQGGGEYLHDHRCAGEPATIRVMQEAVRLLTSAMDYTVPPQDLRVSLRHLPALPASGLVLSDVVAAG